MDLDKVLNKVLVKMVPLIKVLIAVVPMKMVLIIKVLITSPIKVLNKVTFRVIGPTILPIMVGMRMVLTTPIMDLIMFLIKVLIVRIMFLIKVFIRMVLITLVVVVVPTLIVIDVFPLNPCSNNNRPLVVVDHPHLLHRSFALLLMDTIISMIPIVLIIMGSMITVHTWA